MKIALCYPVNARHIADIQAVAPSATVINAGQEGINDVLPDCDIFCGHAKVPVDWQQVVHSGRLKWIQSSAAGMDHCLVPCVVASSILVTSASGLFAEPVAEQTLALLLGVLRSMRDFYEAQRRREFIRLPTRDLHGLTIGIVGFGGNGRRIAEVLTPFRVRLLATDLFPREIPPYMQHVWPADQLPRLLAESDVVILCIPLNESTRGLFNKATFSQAKPGAILVNVARGPVVVEEDLVAALLEKQLSAAALDVTEIEPLPANSPLWDLPNVVITPHVGAQSANRIDITTDFFCQNLRRFLAGQPLRNVVDKQLGFPVPSENV